MKMQLEIPKVFGNKIQRELTVTVLLIVNLIVPPLPTPFKQQQTYETKITSELL